MILLDGILNILKPPGMTSHDVVSIVRKKFAMKKVGHTGTLDPNAAGVLPICLGQATKVSKYLLDSDKKYRVELKLGIRTDTEDIYGSILREEAVGSTREEIKEAILGFIGSYNQVPPMYSAIKVKGKRLYELARKGIEVERKARTVTIYNINIIKIGPDRVLFDVLCSKGTYIRTLCKDIGERLGCGGTMAFLLRTQSGDFNLEDAITIEELLEAEKPEDLLLPLDFPLGHMPRVTVKYKYKKQVLNGGNIFPNYLTRPLDLQLGRELCIYLEEQFVGFGLVAQDKNKNNYIKISRLLLIKE